MVRLYIGEKKCGTFRSNEKVIVLVIDDVKIIKEKIFNHSGKSYPIVCKLFKFPSQEGEKVASKEQDIEFDETFYIDSRNCIRNHSRSLFQKHSNLEMIGASAYRSKKNGCDIVPEPCIVFYCSCKGVKPLEESNFPTTVNGIKTDVREGFFYQSTNEVYSAKSEEDIYPLLTGASISSKDSSIMGTLGGFVKSSNGDIGFITCAHVLFNLSKKCYETEMFDIVQPAYSNNICGVHTYSCFPTTPFPDCTMDASLVILKSRKPEKGLFSNLTAEDFCLLGNGLSKENLPEYSEGDNVRDYDQMQDHGNHLKDPCFKLGAKSGFTKGYLRFNEISVRCYSDEMDVSHSSTPLEIKYYSQLEIKGSDKDFADAGDSGAFVYQLDSSSTKEDKHRLYCIGMIVGNTNFSTVVTPIVPILQTFGAEMYTFPQDKS
ncbi:uncharacterized protein LOC134264523 [Saccostrea cucullata]|uniref:uncharacterized protein LOC134264523 n=1 Tax=Saccostrea cuccullata TaxID=36930 RepID=UPI002ED173A8